MGGTWKYLKDDDAALCRLLSVLSCLIWEGVLTISPLFESLSLCALFTEWWVFTLARARLCFLPFYQSPSVPFHSILPRSRHCSVSPFIRNKVSSGRAQCTPVFLGFLYLFLSSSPFAHASFAKSLQPIVGTSRIDTKSFLSLSLGISFSYLSNVRLKMLFQLIECRTNICCWIGSSLYGSQLHSYFYWNVFLIFSHFFVLHYIFYFWNRLYINKCRLIHVYGRVYGIIPSSF